MLKPRVIFAGLLVICILTFTSLVVLGPIISLYGIHYSLKNDKTMLLNVLVDFPELQLNIKEQIKQKIEQDYEVNLSQSRNPVEQFAKQFVNQILEVSVETAVSPAGIKFLLSGGDFSKVITEKEQGDWQSSEYLEADESSLKSYLLSLEHAEINYQSSHQVSIRLANNTQGIQNTTLIFRRDGVIWKLVDVRLND